MSKRKKEKKINFHEKDPFVKRYLKNLNYKNTVELFLDFKNNFSSLEDFAKYHNLSDEKTLLEFVSDGRFESEFDNYFEEFCESKSTKEFLESI